MGNASARVFIQLVGPFLMRKPTGEDCTPRQRKTCALIALLALAPEYKRTRVWIQDKLWSTRGKEQGAASLRQSLVEIRKVLGHDRGCLVADNFSLALDRRLVSIDLEDTSELIDGGRDVELLEGFDIGDPEFEDWLCGQRQRFSSRVAAAGDTLRTTKAADVREAIIAPQNRLLLFRSTQAGRTNFVANNILDSIAKTLSELGVANISDCASDDGIRVLSGEQDRSENILRLRSDIGCSSNQTIRLALLRYPSDELIWASTLQVPDGAGRGVNDPDMLRYVNLAVSIASDQFTRTRRGPQERILSSALCYSGILHLFRLGQMNFEIADKLFARAFNVEPRGIHLAWRAYLRTFLLAERKYVCRETLDAEAIEFMHRALEMDPHNSYVAGLSAHVQTIMRRSYVAAFELAERSIELNDANPIGWACLGMAKSYLGKPDEGFRDTLVARKIAGSAPYRFQLDALSCIAGTMAGATEKAAYLAEASHALAPEFAPPLRYLSAIYMHRGEQDRSIAMVRKLQTIEPDFSYEILRDKAYPAAGLQQSPIIKSLPRRQV